jgi:hypothetical protein
LTITASSGAQSCRDAATEVQAALPTKILRYIFRVARVPAGDDVSRIRVDVAKGLHLAIFAGAAL